MTIPTCLVTKKVVIWDTLLTNEKEFPITGWNRNRQKTLFFWGGGGVITTFYDKIHAVHLNVRSV